MGHGDLERMIGFFVPRSRQFTLTNWQHDWGNVMCWQKWTGGIVRGERNRE